MGTETMIVRALFLASCCYVLQACASGSIGELRDTAANEHRFTTGENYEIVYRRVSRMARSCWEGGFMFSPQAQRITDADLFSETGTAEITIRMSNIANNVYAHVLIERLDADLTSVTVWNDLATWNSYGERVQLWAEGSEDCER